MPKVKSDQDIEAKFKEYIADLKITENGLNQKECYKLLCEMEKFPTAFDIKKFWKDKELDDENIVDLKQFKELSVTLGDGHARLRDALDIFDTNGDGFIDGAELRAMLNKIDDILDADILDADWQEYILNAADKNGDGKLDKNELASMLTTDLLLVSHHPIKKTDEEEQETV